MLFASGRSKVNGWDQSAPFFITEGQSVFNKGLLGCKRTSQNFYSYFKG